MALLTILFRLKCREIPILLRKENLSIVGFTIVKSENAMAMKTPSSRESLFRIKWGYNLENS